MARSRTIWLVVATLVSLAAGLVGLASSPARGGVAAAGTVVTGQYANAYGARTYRLYIPSGYRTQRAPLVVMLHGCTQTAADFALGTEMDAVAERETFLVLYAEQDPLANPGQCWNWFEPAHQARGAGEPSILAGMTNDVVSRYRVDRSRVYAAGLSAGAAMTVIMGATYPDLYAAIGVSAGLEYRAAANLAEALVAQQTQGPDPDGQGALAALASGGAKRVVPTIVFHGQLDLTVAVANGHQVLAQWAQTNDLVDDGNDNGSVIATPASSATATVPGGYAYTRFVYNDRRGRPLMEKWLIEEMRHAWSGGSSAGSYTDAKGPKASDEMWRFFRDRRNR